MVSAAPLAAFGEVRTCLLPSATALTRTEACDLLALMPGRDISWRERPGSLAVSPSLAVGVDCHVHLGASADDAVASAATATAQIVGTVATRVVLAGGIVLQSSVNTRLVRAADRRRQTWSHYIRRRGVAEVISPLPDRATAIDALVEGYLRGRPHPHVLDLASIGERLLGRIRSDPLLDQQPPLAAGATRLRWTAVIGGAAGPSASLRMNDDTTRSVRLILRQESDLVAAQRFCEDLAAHDWLLTVLSAGLADADRYRPRSPERHDILAALLDTLTGLWMPGAHTPASMRSLWTALQADPGLTRQWAALVERLRDRVAVATLDMVRHKESY
ncbi:SCO2521 family protein [Nocardia stercoris]|uniref:Uncharacterized protein n=1 Tax=Nocardia stercoris TaxID=2483361 RepID=A0A3M2L6V2_9NOCA|nr:SCO2521 family protein [Nocardia stercoris]RMI33257.1 hypothetical protein EBN03_08705 [Nocardia stercoris]